MAELDPIAEARRQWVAHGWSDAADGMMMVTSLVRAHQLLMERIDHVLKPHGLTFARFEILRLLAFTKQGALPMSRLGSLLQVHATSVTSAVSRLEDQTYVKRVPSPDDRRVVLAEITHEGRKVVEAATMSRNELFEEPGIEATETASLLQLLTRFRTAAGDEARRDE